jgi:endonuclease YncB( thermonuclease family)
MQNGIGPVLGDLTRGLRDLWKGQGRGGRWALGLLLAAVLASPLGLVALVLGRENGAHRTEAAQEEQTIALLAALPASGGADSSQGQEVLETSGQASESVQPVDRTAATVTITEAPVLPASTPTHTVEGEWGQVLDVVDGDTIVVLLNGQARVVSYLGIEAPQFGESAQPDARLASEARVANRVLVQGKVVRLEGKESWINERGHLLRYVWLDDEMINATLVRLGYARCSPDAEASVHGALLARLEQEARQGQLGIWEERNDLAMALVLPSELPTSAASGTPDGEETLVVPEGGAEAGMGPTLAASSDEVRGQPLDIPPAPATLEAPPDTALAATSVPTMVPTLNPPTPQPPPTSVPTVPPPTVAPPTALPPPTAPPAPPTAAPVAGGGGVQIIAVYADGVNGRSEPDEYCEIKNTGSESTNLAGWRLNAGAQGQDFTFPAYVLAPGQTCRVYTNETHSESGGLSFASGRALWSNAGDCGYLYDASGQQVSAHCY